MDRNDDALTQLAASVLAALGARNAQLACAESCTGGWIAKALTDVAGSSASFGWGYVCYANAAKTAMLGVPQALLDAHGAVSEPVVRRMAEGARERSAAAYSVAVSGIAGPDGGSADKPVGTVWFAWATSGAVHTARHVFGGDRDSVRRAAVHAALAGVLDLLGDDAG
jgi:nicotinamide-nucleotide amidase